MLAFVQHGEAKFTSTGAVDTSAGRAVLERWSAPAAVDEAFDALRSSWDRLLGGFQVTCPDEHLGRMVNAWNQYQCMATFNLSRSASLFETGIGRGMGFRDSNQDLLGFVHMIPGRARQRLLDLAATQLSDGTCFHQYQPLTRQGNADVGGDFYDDHLWLVLSSCAYIKETGDVSVLDAPCGYADRTYADDDERENLLHHLETSLAYTMAKRGPHGLPLIGHADWNDCLNLNCFSTEPNESFQTAGDVAGSPAESVMIAGLFLAAAEEMAALHDHLEPRRRRRTRPLVARRDPRRTGRARLGWRVVASRLRRRGQTGRVGAQRRGPDLRGEPGLVRPRRRRAPMAALVRRSRRSRPTSRRRTASCSSSRRTPGTTSSSARSRPTRPASRRTPASSATTTRGSTSPGAGWATATGRSPDTTRSVRPPRRTRSTPTAVSRTSTRRPSPVPTRPTFGEAKNSWLTGTAAWTFVVASQGILGIQPDHVGLAHRPVHPAVVARASVSTAGSAAPTTRSRCTTPMACRRGSAR